MDNNDLNPDDGELTLLAETANYAVMVAEDLDGESIYNVQIGSVTLHLFEEEWDELVQLIRRAAR
jgi:hypothetical protein